MNHKQAVNWLINLSADIGKVEHSDLWHYEQALYEIREMLESDEEERKQGHWTNLVLDSEGCGSAECALCHSVVHNNFFKAKVRYCPHCGGEDEWWYRMTRKEAAQIIKEAKMILLANVWFESIEQEIKESFEMAIKALEEPEIIKCKDCKHLDYGIDEEGTLFLKCLHGRSYGGTQANDYCSWAEVKDND